MKQIIPSHNSKVLRKSSDAPPNKTCNCRVKDSCPLEGKCLSDNLIYQATVTLIPALQYQSHTNQNNSPQIHTYIGLTSNTFKTRLGNHKKSFSHRKYGKETTLSRKIWELKDDGYEYDINWKIMKQAQPFSPVSIIWKHSINSIMVMFGTVYNVGYTLQPGKI